MTLDSDNLPKVPFRSYTLDEDKKDDGGKILTIRLNSQEYMDLLTMMHTLRISNASTALKELAFVGKNVISVTFTPDFLKWLTDSERRVDDSKLRKLMAKKDQNVIQKLRNM